MRGSSTIAAWGSLATGTFALAACTFISGASDLEGNEGSAGSTSSSSSGSTSSSSSTSSTSSGGGSSSSSTSSGTNEAGSGDCTLAIYGPSAPQLVTGLYWETPEKAKQLDKQFTQGIPIGDIGGGDSALRASKFGFAVPANAMIHGIKVEIARSSSGGGQLTDDKITLSKGAPKASAEPWPNDDSMASFPMTSYGDITDLWGATWTPADINAETFSASLSIKGLASGNVDAVQVTIFATVCER